MGETLSALEIRDNVYFYNPDLFPHLQPLIQNHQIITQELHAALLTKIIQPESENGAKLSGLWCGDKAMDEFFAKNKGEEGWIHWWSVHSSNPHTQWTVYPLVHEGELATENCRLLPETSRLLSQVKGIRVAGFSRLEPKAIIETHTGFTGREYGALTFHLGLLIPPTGCVLRCGPKKHEWRRAGQVIIFDDTYPHSAENMSDQQRIVLYVDFKIPEDVLPSLPPINVADSSDEDNEQVSDNRELQSDPQQS